MADKREQILTRLVEICEGIQYVVKVGRNVSDVPGKARPAILVHDGAESVNLEPPMQPRIGIQIMDLNPHITILVNATAADQMGPLLNQFRRVLLRDIVGDETLADLSQDGNVRYDGNEMVPPETSDQREGRMELDFTIRYVLRAADLIASD